MNMNSSAAVRMFGQELASFPFVLTIEEMVPLISTPKKDPRTLPTPPVSSVPPMTAELMASISRPSAWETEPANNPADFGPVLARYPQLKLQLCHMGGTYRGCVASIDLANKYEHVYLDINGSLYSQIWIEELVKEAPLERFVFGTDQTFNDPRIMIGRVLASELEDDIKRKIVAENFENLIGRTLGKGACAPA